MNTSNITREAHVHKPVTRMLMSYSDKQGKRVTKLLDMRHTTTGAFIFQTLRWASHNGVEVTFRPA
jgi:hypothetical protein